jgi:hypothetical protein
MSFKQVNKSDPSHFINVRQPKGPVGKSCLHCNRPGAVLVDIRFSTKRDAMRMPDMVYCQEHAEARGVFG